MEDALTDDAARGGPIARSDPTARPGPIDGVDWDVAAAPVAYPDALARMDARAAAIVDRAAPELVWLLEHPPLYTAGTSADPAELVDPARFPVFPAGRGGRYTYHGPGQRVGYVMLDLGTRGRDVRRFVHALEGWVIATLAAFGIAAHRAEGRIGIWTPGPRGEAKIGAIGVRVRRWVTLHGFSVNLAPALDHFAGIVPCGIADHPVTSAEELGIPIDRDAFDDALRKNFPLFLGELRQRADAP